MANVNEIIRTDRETFDSIVDGTHTTETYNDNNVYQVELDEPIELGASGSGMTIKDNQLVLSDIPYELIETITLTEATTQIDRSQTPLGKNYNFKKMLIEITCPVVATAATGNIGANYGSGMKVYCTAFHMKTTICRNVSELKVENGLFSCNGYNSYTASGYGASATMVYFDGAYKPATSNITNIRISYANGIPSGTVINIYGIWA